MSPAVMLAAALLAAVVLALLWKLTRPKKEKPWLQTSTCPACGWSGKTSRYAGRCPRCNGPIGDRKANRRT